MHLSADFTQAPLSGSKTLFRRFAIPGKCLFVVFANLKANFVAFRKNCLRAPVACVCLMFDLFEGHTSVPMLFTSCIFKSRDVMGESYGVRADLKTDNPAAIHSAQTALKSHPSQCMDEASKSVARWRPAARRAGGSKLRAAACWPNPNPRQDRIPAGPATAGRGRTLVPMAAAAIASAE